jgi:hypothetical protein
MAASENFAQLAQALRDRKAVIADREFYARDPSAHLARLQAVSHQITALAAGLPKPVDPQLAHFLERCSYEKALALLEEGALDGQA